MCYGSFERAILSSRQFLKYDLIEKAQMSLKFAKKYSNSMVDMLIISDIELEIQKVLTKLT